MTYCGGCCLLVCLPSRGSPRLPSYYALSGFTSVLREEQARATDSDIAFLEQASYRGKRGQGSPGGLLNFGGAPDCELCSIVIWTHPGGSGH